MGTNTRDYVCAIFAGTGISEDTHEELFWRAVQLLEMHANEELSEVLDDIAYDQYYSWLTFGSVYITIRNGEKDVIHASVNALQNGLHKLADEFSERNTKNPELIALIKSEWDRYLELYQQRKALQEVEKLQRERKLKPWYMRLWGE